GSPSGPLAAGRHRMRDGDLPALLMATLPHLSDDPDTAFDALTEAMLARPKAPIAEHYRALFTWLATKLPREQPARVAVERSGGTLRIVARLLETFPEARFLHLVRDGRNTAISMSRHIGFRMALIGFQLLEFLGLDPYEDDSRDEVDDLPDELVHLLPENFSAEAFRSYDLSPALCGHYWSGEVQRGVELLSALPADRLLTMRYEDILLSPRDSIARIGTFLFDDAAAPVGIDPHWLTRATALVGRGRSAWQSLPPAERRELEDACAPGFAALAAHGLHWSDDHEKNRLAMG
ncbi:MAG: sulfotransferase, partial [Myxococcales bacterium]|nr:sulfotransferase [Myxococcales bacterium]